MAAGHGLPSRKAIWVSSGPPGLPSGHQAACSGCVRCEPRYGLRLHRDSGLSSTSDALTTMFVLEIGGWGLADNEPVGGGHALVVGHVEQVVHGAPVHASQQRQQVRCWPAASGLRSLARPVLILTQVRAGHGDRGPVRAHPRAGSVCADLLSGLGLRPAVGVPPCGPGRRPYRRANSTAICRWPCPARASSPARCAARPADWFSRTAYPLHSGSTSTGT